MENNSKPKQRVMVIDHNSLRGTAVGMAVATALAKQDDLNVSVHQELPVDDKDLIELIDKIRQKVTAGINRMLSLDVQTREQRVMIMDGTALCEECLGSMARTERLKKWEPYLRDGRAMAYIDRFFDQAEKMVGKSKLTSKVKQAHRVLDMMVSDCRP